MRIKTIECYVFSELDSSTQKTVIDSYYSYRIDYVRKEIERVTRGFQYLLGLHVHSNTPSDLDHSLLTVGDMASNCSIGDFLKIHGLQDRFPKTWRVRNRNHGIWVHACVTNQPNMFHSFPMFGLWHKKSPLASEFKLLQYTMDRIICHAIDPWRQQVTKLRAKYLNRDNMRSDLMCCDSILFDKIGRIVQDPAYLPSVPEFDYRVHWAVHSYLNRLKFPPNEQSDKEGI